MVNLLIEYGANWEAKGTAEANAYNYDWQGQTILHYAVEQGSPSVAAVFVDKGADVNVKDDNGQTPVYLANNAYILDYMIKAGADMTVKDNEGRTPYAYFVEQDARPALMEVFEANGITQ